MRITHFELLRVPPSWIWLKICTDTELFGWGEPYLENHPESVIAEVRRLEPLLVGEDPCQVAKHWQTMYEGGSGYVGGPVKMSAISGIDMALWDLAGKAANLPIYSMLGGACRDQIRMYRAIGGELPWCVEPGQPYDAGFPPKHNLKVDSPEAYSEAARIMVEEWGFRCLKLHVSMRDSLEPTSDVKRIEEAFVAVRSGAGPEIEVAIDLHNPHPVIAKQLISALTPHRPLFIEEPAPVERVDVLAEIGRFSEIPIAAGERWMGKWVFYDALRKNALTVLQPDLCHVGGISESHKGAVMGESAYAKLALHCPLSPLALAASIQIDACVPNFLVQENNEVNISRVGGKTLFGAGYFKDPFELDTNGCVSIPDKPGLGIEIDPIGFDKIMARPWRVSRG